MFSFLSPGEQNNNAQPNTTGIIAVPEELSKYPQNPTKIKIKEMTDELKLLSSNFKKKESRQ